MWDGLLDLLQQWWEGAICWLLELLVSMVGVLFDLYSLIIPSVPVPGFLSTPGPFLTSSLEVFAYFFPAPVALYLLTFYVSIEITVHVLIPVFRSVMDLL